MKLSKLSFIPLIGLFMGSCDMIDYHPYDVRISGPTDINNRNIAKIEANCKDKTTIRFVTMGDSQRWYDETQDFRYEGIFESCQWLYGARSYRGL